MKDRRQLFKILIVAAALVILFWIFWFCFVPLNGFVPLQHRIAKAFGQVPRVGEKPW